MSVDDIGVSVSFEEAYALIKHLEDEPGSKTYQRLSGGKFPADRQYMALVTLINTLIPPNYDVKNLPMEDWAANSPYPYAVEGEGTVKMTPEQARLDPRLNAKIAKNPA